LKGVAEAEDVHSYVKNNAFGIPAIIRDMNNEGFFEQDNNKDWFFCLTALLYSSEE
jgi:hypothetical protein